MNTYQFKNNTYKNGMWHPDHSKAMAKENGKSIKKPPQFFYGGRTFQKRNI